MNHKDYIEPDEWKAPWEEDNPDAWTHAQRQEGKRKFYATQEYLDSIGASADRMCRFILLFGRGMGSTSYTNWLNRMTVWVAAAENEIKRKNMLRQTLTDDSDQPTI